MRTAGSREPSLRGRGSVRGEGLKGSGGWALEGKIAFLPHPQARPAPEESGPGQGQGAGPTLVRRRRCPGGGLSSWQPKSSSQPQSPPFGSFAFVRNESDGVGTSSHLASLGKVDGQTAGQGQRAGHSHCPRQPHEHQAPFGGLRAPQFSQMPPCAGPSSWGLIPRLGPQDSSPESYPSPFHGGGLVGLGLPVGAPGGSVVSPRVVGPLQ